MNRQDLQKIIIKKRIPDKPGVYLFKKNKAILYLGKATSLRDRIRSYFSDDLIKTRGMLLVDMISRANTIDVIPTDSVLEAFILETELIKKHQPIFNTKEKDDKSFNYVVITNEKFPRVLIMRGRNLEQELNGEDNLNSDAKNKLLQKSLKKSKKYLYTFGPYPYGAQLQEALKLVRKIFPFRDKCQSDQKKPCFNYSIGLCPGTCFNLISAQDYRKTIRHIALFFQGKKKSLTSSLKKEMRYYSKSLEFEKAAKIKKTLDSLAHIQDISLMKRGQVSGFRKTSQSTDNTTYKKFRIEAYDIAHLSGKNMVGVMTVLTDGEFNKNEYRKFNIRTVDSANDTAALKEVLSRRLSHSEWQQPDLIVIDGGIQQLNLAEKTLPPNIPIVSLVKDSRHKAREILISTRNKSDLDINVLKNDIVKINAECHRFAITFHRKKRSNNLWN